MQRLLTLRAFSRAIERDEVLGNRAGLLNLQSCIELVGFSKAETDILRKKVAEALERLPGDPAENEALQKLAGSSRGVSAGWVGPRKSGTLSFDGDTYILVSFQYKGLWNHDGLSTAYWSVVNDAVAKKYTAPTEQTVNVPYAQMPVAFGYYNITKKTGSYCLATGALKKSSGGYGDASQVMEFSGTIHNRSGWTPPYDWDPVRGTRYHHRLSFAGNGSGGLQFILRNPIR
jgi:hypothetical protein